MWLSETYSLSWDLSLTDYCIIWPSLVHIWLRSTPMTFFYSQSQCISKTNVSPIDALPMLIQCTDHHDALNLPLVSNVVGWRSVDCEDQSFSNSATEKPCRYRPRAFTSNNRMGKCNLCDLNVGTSFFWDFHTGFWDYLSLNQPIVKLLSSWRSLF